MDIKLLNGPTTGKSNCKNCANGWGGLDNRTKSLIVVESFLLVEAFRHKTGFVAFNRAIGMLEHPIMFILGVGGTRVHVLFL